MRALLEAYRLLYPSSQQLLNSVGSDVLLFFWSIMYALLEACRYSFPENVGDDYCGLRAVSVRG